MSRFFLSFAALNGFLSVILGAFSAHSLKSKVSANYLDVFNTAAEYQMAHALTLLIVCILMLKFPSVSLKVGAWAFSLGLLIFPGSLYLLVLLDLPLLGAVTPLGGIAFLVGWSCLLVFGFRQKDDGNKA
ncbi:MAG: DUF423 domain-containing protein [Pseudomonadales bacterium]